MKIFKNSRIFQAGDEFVELNGGIKDPNSLLFSSESLGKSFAGKGQSWKEQIGNSKKILNLKSLSLDRTYEVQQVTVPFLTIFCVRVK